MAETVTQDDTLIADGTQALLDAVDAHAAAMKARLLANRHKNGLTRTTTEHLLARFRAHADNLDSLGQDVASLGAPGSGWQTEYQQALALAAANVSNFAMLLVLKARQR